MLYDSEFTRRGGSRATAKIGKPETKRGDFVHRPLDFRLRLPFGRCAATLLATLLVVVGCEQNPNRYAVEGTVTLDGEPLDEGQIRLVPQRGTSGPSSGAPIREGRFSIARDRGPFAGEFTVEITAVRETGEILNHPDEGPVPLTAQYLPARYNSKSDLTASVKAGEPNLVEFKLTSDEGP